VSSIVTGAREEVSRPDTFCALSEGLTEIGDRPVKPKVTMPVPVFPPLSLTFLKTRQAMELSNVMLGTVNIATYIGDTGAKVIVTTTTFNATVELEGKTISAHR
jgi:hypothetical protein